LPPAATGLAGYFAHLVEIRAEVSLAVTAGRHGLASYFGHLVEIHSAPRWL